MMGKTNAFQGAFEALSQLGIPGRLSDLHDAGISIQRTILGGSHSVVTYPPLNSLQKLEPNDDIHPIYFGESTSLYIHIAFCETKCSFCHYAVRNYRGKSSSPPSRAEMVNDYLTALAAEIDDWSVQLNGEETTINSIYIGGGTPLILETGQLISLLEHVQQKFSVLPNAEICVEGSPLTITAVDGPTKLKALKAHGVTRLSFGGQSFDDEVLRRAARGYKQDVLVQACETVSRYFDNWNLDLIQSLYKGNKDEVWHNLQMLEKLRPPHITWYHGRFASRPQGAWLNDAQKSIDFETEEETLFGRMLLWQQLTEMGYSQVDGNRFVQSEQYIDPFKKIRTSVSNNLLGLGASAYSHVDMRPYPRWFTVPEGVFFRNVTDIGEYMRRMQTGQDAVGSALALNYNEYLAAAHATSLRTGILLSEVGEFSSTNQAKHYRNLRSKLLSLGLLERFRDGSKNGIRLSTLGQLYEDEVLSSFYSPTVQELLIRAA
ncbi:MAG: radical SAM protein [Patescibacteria group bacterium]